MRAIPDRWLEYSAIGKQVAGTCFIPFKVPLKQTVSNRMDPKDRFMPEDLLKQCPNIKLVIDLTNTTRYYNKEEFLSRGVLYEKLKVPGRKIPKKPLVFGFFRIVDNFLSLNLDEDSMIGIHCTHGLNRTSYFICSYMIKRMNMTVKQAIEAFQEARGHEVERAYYVSDLQKLAQDSDFLTKLNEDSLNRPAPDRSNLAQAEIEVSLPRKNRKNRKKKTKEGTGQQQDSITGPNTGYPRNGFQNGVRNSFQEGARNSFQEGARNKFQKGARNKFQNGARNKFQNGARNQFQNGARYNVQYGARNTYFQPALDVPASSDSQYQYQTSSSKQGHEVLGGLYPDEARSYSGRGRGAHHKRGERNPKGGRKNRLFEDS